MKFVRFVLEWLRSKHLQRAKRLMKVWTARYPVEFFAGVGGIVLILWVLSPIVMWLFFGSGAGPKGDSFGALTSLFTGAAFVGLIATLMQQQREIRMQRQDLKLQRDEMKASRAELSGQKEQMALQNQSLKQQMFEQTFFNLLAAFGRFIDGISGPLRRNGGVPRVGREQLGHITKVLVENIWIEKDRRSTKRPYDQTIGEYRDSVAPYFRQLESILQFIDQSTVADKKRYADYLRAQMSESELVLVAVFCSTPAGAALDLLTQKYEILKYLPIKAGNASVGQICAELREQTWPSNGSIRF